MLTRTEGTLEKTIVQKTDSRYGGEEKGFNKKRLDGLDKGAPKHLKLKSISINPMSTIFYVQVSIFTPFLFILLKYFFYC